MQAVSVDVPSEPSKEQASWRKVKQHIIKPGASETADEGRESLRAQFALAHDKKMQSSENAQVITV